MAGKTVYIGSGAGFAGDRIDAGLPVVRTLARRDGSRYLIFEVMGERTLAIAQRIRMTNPDQGYSPYLEPYLRGVLKEAKSSGVRIVANLGNANPLGGARRTRIPVADRDHDPSAFRALARLPRCIPFRGPA
mgnify:CR=1 FL=1